VFFIVNSDHTMSTTIAQVRTHSNPKTLAELPDHPGVDETVPHAPKRPVKLSASEFKLALKNALRHFPESMHEMLAPEFAQELQDLGHIYMHRLRPTYQMKAYPVNEYPARCQQAAAIQMMIMNNLDPEVAQFPHELITYGGNGSVFSNWAQYNLAMQYLSEMTESQTLVMNSGHPLGLFPSHPDAPRVVVTNGMVIPNHSSREDYDLMYAQGVSQYGQMTAGSYCYIGPQGIVHGTTITLLNAARKYLQKEDMRGLVYVTSGLGGMSGAQPKAGKICGCISVTAEVDASALYKRHGQGWVEDIVTSVDECIALIRKLRENPPADGRSIGFLGNVVSLWEALAELADRTGETLVDLASDQTSLHNPFLGGYYPVQLSFEEGRDRMAVDPANFKALVQESLRRHVAAINKLCSRGMRFWDYGNAFLLESSKAGADIMADEATAAATHSEFKYPSYVQDIMGDIFSLGFGPFRWVCASGEPADLAITDRIAAEILRELIVELQARRSSPPPQKNSNAAGGGRAGMSAKEHENYVNLTIGQLKDNLRWIEQAEENHMVVGSQARILYCHSVGRVQLALAFNKAVRDGVLQGPVVMSRDHHDVSGTDSPYRETSNCYDGSQFTADMAVQNVIGDAARGATWVSLHNGGGTGWGEAVNGGFGFVLDGTDSASRRAENMLHWDVNNGISRRAWSGNANAQDAIREEMRQTPELKVTLAADADPQLLERVTAGCGFGKSKL